MWNNNHMCNIGEEKHPFKKAETSARPGLLVGGHLPLQKGYRPTVVVRIRGWRNSSHRATGKHGSVPQWTVSKFSFPRTCEPQIWGNVLSYRKDLPDTSLETADLSCWQRQTVNVTEARRVRWTSLAVIYPSGTGRVITDDESHQWQSSLRDHDVLINNSDCDGWIHGNTLWSLLLSGDSRTHDWTSSDCRQKKNVPLFHRNCRWEQQESNRRIHVP